MALLCGIDIGGTKCAVVLGDERGRVLKKLRLETSNCEETLKGIIAAADSLGGFDAIGISCGGPLDEKRGIINSPPNLPGWDGVRITDMLTERYGVPCGIRNDANACALAEWRYGAGMGTENMVFMTFGTGLGVGLILNGRLYGGATGNAGEIGHIRLAEHGPSGYGKCGSFEGFCSGGGLYELGRAKAREYLQRGIRPSFISGTAYDFSVADMAEAARGGDACALEVFELCAVMLGRGLAMICDLLDPELIIIGSVYARCRDLLEERTLEVMGREVLPPIKERVRITVPAIGEGIGDAAALAVALETFERSADK